MQKTPAKRISLGLVERASQKESTAPGRKAGVVWHHIQLGAVESALGVSETGHGLGCGFKGWLHKDIRCAAA
jgi:hypothetical protein